MDAETGDDQTIDDAETEADQRPRNQPDRWIDVDRQPGGGDGNPLARPFAEVAEDVRAGLVSPGRAWTVYGVRIATDLSVDEAASRPRAALG
jgi:N-methylhydantoinase B/oxoprolinase/acetone carboxylase alpha subunit